MLRSLICGILGSDCGDVTTTEYVIAAVGALFFSLLYFGFKRIIFYSINDSVENAKYGALILSASLAISWVIASLDLLGPFSSIIALVVVALSLVFDLVYLVVTRKK